MIENLKPIVQIIKQLENTSSTKDKENILRANADNELLKKILRYTYDSDLKYGIQKKSIVVRDGESKWDSLFDMLDYLASSNINNDLKINVGRFLGNIEDEDERDLVIRILLKDLRTNTKEKLINKAIPGLIITHDIMLGSKWDGKIKEKVAVELKLDGIRSSWLVKNGKAICKSRQNKIIEGMDELTKEIERLSEGMDLFIDGELLATNEEGLDSKELFKKTSSIVNSKGKKENLTLVAFDVLPLSDYENKVNKIPFIDRRQRLEDLVKGSKLVTVAPLYFITNDVDKINDKLKEVVSEGLEGLMLSKISGFYEFKRSKNLQKVKKFNDGDMLVYDIFEGDGAIKGMLGGVKLKGLYNGEILYSDCGSGFTLDERKYLWEHPEEILNKVCTIKFFEVTENSKTKVKSLRFCTWQGMEYIRHDKQGIEDTNID